jgi:hypothetical protein
MNITAEGRGPGQEGLRNIPARGSHASTNNTLGLGNSHARLDGLEGRSE